VSSIFRQPPFIALTWPSNSAIGIIGATVMPHSLFLGSALATQDRLSNGPTKALDSAYSLDTTVPVPLYRRLAASAVQTFKEGFKVSPAYRARPTRYSDRENNSLEFIGSHLTHGVVDIAGSLLGFAVLINAMWVFESCRCLVRDANKLYLAPGF
jgi:metal iron transporter